MAQMTLREKVQQLGSTWPGAASMDGDVAPMQDTLLQAEPFDEAVRDGLGQLTRAFGTAPISVPDGRTRLVDLQRRVVAANRFGIPAIAHEECLTGFTAWTATVFPTPLAWAATNNPVLIEQMGRAIGENMRAVGVHQGLAPVLDVVRDYRWGRVEETLGEDPTLVAEIGTAYVRGLQSGGVIATLKHFAGYSASRGARNHAPVSIGPLELANVILPPFARAVIDGRVGSVMNSYADIDGVPPAADRRLLTEVLRKQWGFTGTVVSDYWAVPFLVSTHRVADDIGTAGVMSLQAGMDVELPHTLAFGSHLVDAVAAGTLDEGDIDTAVRRLLLQKVALGLLDDDWSAEADGLSSIDLDSPFNRSIAEQVAEESVILLHNDDAVLPVQPSIQRIAVIGPGGNDSACLFGCYSFPNHVVVNHPGLPLGIEAPTILDAVRQEFPAAEVVGVDGCAINGDDMTGIDAATAAAAAADLVILVVGDRSGMFGHGTSGEGCDVSDLTLPGRQEDLVAAVLDVATPVVFLALSGRPYAIGEHAVRASAALQVFFPGEAGAAAIAGVLSGRVEPSGRLPVQIPRRSAPQPGTYLAPPLALQSDGISNLDPTPAYPFGHGLSYSTLSIRDVSIGARTTPVDGTVVIDAELVNDGARPAWHVPQVYANGPAGRITRPVRRRIASARRLLPPNSAVRVRFTIPADLLGWNDADSSTWVHPGKVTFAVGMHAADERALVTTDLVGAPRMLNLDRSWDATVEFDD